MSRTLILVLLPAAAAIALLAFVLAGMFSLPAALPPPVTPSPEGGGPAAAPPPPLPAPPEDETAPPGDDGALRGSIAGTVREAVSGTPVAGAEVGARLGRWRGAARTSASGGYRIERVPPGGVQVRVTTDHLVDPPPAFVSVEPGIETRADFDLEAGATITGCVRDRRTDELLAGVELTLMGRNGKRSVTGPDGVYRIRGAKSGLAFLSASAPDYPLVRVQVDVPDGATEVVEDLALVRGATVRGAVVVRDGGPVEGARVTAVGARRAVESAADGGFTLRGVPVGRMVWIQANREGFVTARSAPLRFESGEEHDGVRLELVPGGAVRGRVLLADGSPAVGAMVRLVPRERQPGMRTAVGRSGKDGRFTIEPVAPGEYEAVATLAGSVEARVPVPPVEEGGAREDVEIRLGAGESIEGVVRDDTGRPLPGVRITARIESGGQPPGRWGTARSDGEGRFRLTGLAPGTWRVVALPPKGGGGDEASGVPTGTTDLALTIPSGGAVSGRVVDAGGRPAAAFVLRLDPEESGRKLRPIFKRVTDPEGSFRVEGVPRGVWTLSASAAGAFSATRAGVEVAPGREAGGYVLRLLPPATLRGRVLGGPGEPVEGARIMVGEGGDLRRRSVRAARTDREGRFDLPGLRPGTYRVTATKDGRTAVEEAVEVGAGAEVALDLVLPGEGRLVVRVRDGEGRPVADATVMVRGPGGVWVPVSVPDPPSNVPPEERSRYLGEARARAMRTDGSGNCVRERVPEGDLAVSVFAAGFADASATATVRAGRSTDVTVVMEPGTSSRERKERDRGGGNR